MTDRDTMCMCGLDSACPKHGNSVGPRELDDGFGNVFLMCKNPKCDLEIVRPGKVQCSEECDWE